MRVEFSVVLTMLLAVNLTGCGSRHSASPPVEQPPGHTHDGHAHDGHTHDDHAASAAPHADDHSGWWCNEHGVPEAVCALCNSKVAAEFQKKGDWCQEHDRPDSQCFLCHPELEAKFAAQYEAKYGKKPPKPQG